MTRQKTLKEKLMIGTGILAIIGVASGIGYYITLPAVQKSYEEATATDGKGLNEYVEDETRHFDMDYLDKMIEDELKETHHEDTSNYMQENIDRIMSVEEAKVNNTPEENQKILEEIAINEYNQSSTYDQSSNINYQGYDRTGHKYIGRNQEFTWSNNGLGEPNEAPSWSNVGEGEFVILTNPQTGDVYRYADERTYGERGGCWSNQTQAIQQAYNRTSMGRYKELKASGVIDSPEYQKQLEDIAKRIANNIKVGN